MHRPGLLQWKPATCDNRYQAAEPADPKGPIFIIEHGAMGSPMEQNVHRAAVLAGTLGEIVTLKKPSDYPDVDHVHTVTGARIITRGATKRPGGSWTADSIEIEIETTDKQQRTSRDRSPLAACGKSR